MLMKRLLLFSTAIFFSFGILYGQTLKWSAFVDTSTTFSSPRGVDLTGDNILDIVIGAGLDGSPEARGVNAINGADGTILWSFPTEEEIFGSAQFMDITGDNVKDVFIGGRYAEFYAIDGATGTMIWEFFPYSPTVAMDSGWYNFYSPQFVPDQNSDSYKDILVANGGNHSAPPWDTIREPGMLMVLDALTGNILAKDTMPDGEETYCSPVLADFGGVSSIVFGSGGENDGGALWRVPLLDLMGNDISNSQMLASDPSLGFIAPSSIADLTSDGNLDIINQAYDGTLRAFDGISGTMLWELENPGTESSAAPTIGNFIGDNTPDVFTVLAKGTAPTFTDYYQVMVDGSTGQIAWKDSIGALHFASSSAVDLDLNGRDEVLVSLNNHNGTNFSHQLLSIDFQNGIIDTMFNEQAGVNLACTPMIEDIDGNGFLDFVFAFRADSVNPMGANGFYVNCIEGANTIPGVGVAWGNYMGTNKDGHYTYDGYQCGTLTVGSAFQDISCNGFADASISVTPFTGIAPYSYLWNTGEISWGIDSLDVGNYDVIVTDSTGCYTQLSFTTADPYVITMGGITSLNCPGDSTAQATVNSSGCPCMFSTCEFDWSSGDSTKTAYGLSAGWHYVTIIHMDGCVVVDSVYIDEPYPIVDSVVYSDILCATDPFASSFIELILSDSINTTLTWNTGDSIPYIDSLLVGQYSVDLSDIRGCVASDTFNINAPDTMLVNYLVNDALCYGDSTGTITTITNGGLGSYSFQWSNLETTSDIYNLQSGYYDLIVTDSVGCVGITDSIFVGQPPELFVSISNYWNDSIGTCNGGASVIASGGSPGYTYTWSDPQGTIGQSVSGLCEGVYYIVITDSIGCQVQDSVIILNTLGIGIQGIENDVYIYPNPTSNMLNVVLGKNHSFIKIYIVDKNGKIVLNKIPGTDEYYRISLEALHSGIYKVILAQEYNKAVVIPLVITN